MKREFTTDEKLAGVERLIEVMRWSRSQPETEQHEIRDILKAIARDLRAAEPGATLRTMNSLDFRVRSARRQQAQLGYVEIGALQGIGEEVMGKWPEIRRALEAMEGDR